MEATLCQSNTVLMEFCSSQKIKVLPHKLTAEVYTLQLLACITSSHVFSAKYEPRSLLMTLNAVSVAAVDHYYCRWT